MYCWNYGASPVLLLCRTEQAGIAVLDVDGGRLSWALC